MSPQQREKERIENGLQKLIFCEEQPIGRSYICIPASALCPLKP